MTGYQHPTESGRRFNGGSPSGSSQEDLFSQVDATDREPALTPVQRFEAFHAANPQVYELLVREARRWRETRGEKLGIEFLFNRARWVLCLETTGDAFRLNDHYCPFYARLVMLNEPDLDGIFNLRKAVEADAWIGRIRASRKTAA